MFENYYEQIKKLKSFNKEDILAFASIEIGDTYE